MPASRARGAGSRFAQFAKTSASTGRTSDSCCALNRSRTKNSPSRWRFRPPLPRTFGFRLLPSGAASTYSRSVLGARRNLRVETRPCKPRRHTFAAFCAREIVHISTTFPPVWGELCGYPARTPAASETRFSARSSRSRRSIRQLSITCLIVQARRTPRTGGFGLLGSG